MSMSYIFANLFWMSVTGIWTFILIKRQNKQVEKMLKSFNEKWCSEEV